MHPLTEALFLISAKVYLQFSLERNLLNSSYIFLLDVNCENLTVGMYAFIISSIVAKI